MVNEKRNMMLVESLNAAKYEGSIQELGNRVKLMVQEEVTHMHYEYI